MRKDLRGMILADALTGLGILLLLGLLCAGMAQVRLVFIYDPKCEEMREIWTSAEVKSICQPPKPLIVIDLEEEKDSP